MAHVDQSRRRFLTAMGAFGALAGEASLSLTSAEESSAPKTSDTVFALQGRNLKIFSPLIKEPTRILQISDSHLFLDDERGEEYKSYSDRMGKAYNVVKDFRTGKESNPMAELQQIAAEARDKQYDAMALTGDIVSFPSSAGVDFVKEVLAPVNVPYYYVSGNHDWHFEGMEGSEQALREEWIAKKLTSLYPENVNPLAYSVVVKGVKMLMIDDSIYKILPEQLDFLQKELSDGMPAALFMHIPLYAYGRGVGYGVGHPDWNAAHDKNYQIERRERWPEAGHDAIAYDFRDLAISAPNLLGVFTGHIHVQTLDVINGKPSHVAPAALDGSTVTIEFLPTPK